jgi:RimJ/RimL family protein N-acetyltransferase
MSAVLVFDEPQRIGAWVAAQVEQSASWGDFHAIGAVLDGEVVAGVVFNNYNGVNCTVHIAIVRRGRFLIELFRAVCDYAFRHCGLKRMTGMVPASKPQVLAFDLHLGFEEEFVMREAAFDGGDLPVLVMRPAGCRWLAQ